MRANLSFSRIILKHWCCDVGESFAKKKFIIIRPWCSFLSFFIFQLKISWAFSLAIIYSIRGSFLSVFQPAHIQIEFSTFTGWSSKEKIESQKTHKFQSEIYMEIHKKKARKRASP